MITKFGQEVDIDAYNSTKNDVASFFRSPAVVASVFYLCLRVFDNEPNDSRLGAHVFLKVRFAVATNRKLWWLNRLTLWLTL